MAKNTLDSKFLFYAGRALIAFGLLLMLFELSSRQDGDLYVILGFIHIMIGHVIAPFQFTKNAVLSFFKKSDKTTYTSKETEFSRASKEGETPDALKITDVAITPVTDEAINTFGEPGGIDKVGSSIDLSKDWPTYKTFVYAYLIAVLIGSGPSLVLIPLVPLYPIVFPLGLTWFFLGALNFDFTFKEGILILLVIYHSLYFSIATFGVYKRSIIALGIFLVILSFNVCACWMIWGALAGGIHI